jgi:hypothetical protein
MNGEFPLVFPDKAPRRPHDATMPRCRRRYSAHVLHSLSRRREPDKRKRSNLILFCQGKEIILLLNASNCAEHSKSHNSWKSDIFSDKQLFQKTRRKEEYEISYFACASTRTSLLVGKSLNTDG